MPAAKGPTAVKSAASVVQEAGAGRSTSGTTPGPIIGDLNADGTVSIRPGNAVGVQPQPGSSVAVTTGRPVVTGVGGNGGVAGELTGTRTVIPPLSDVATTRSLIRENESADILASNGYKVEQNPPTLPNGKNPDYVVNGQVFDNYAPSTSSVRNAWSEIDKKVARGQANNVVVNLADSSISPAALREQVMNYPIPGLKQVIIIDKSGTPIVIKLGGN